MTKMNFNFMGYRRITALMSSIFVLISIISLFARGLDLGLDFTSGTSVRLSFAQSVNINDISSKLSAAGYDDLIGIFVSFLAWMNLSTKRIKQVKRLK